MGAFGHTVEEELKFSIVCIMNQATPCGQVRHKNVEQVKSFLLVFVQRKCDLPLCRTTTKRSTEEEASSCSVDFQVKKWLPMVNPSITRSPCNGLFKIEQFEA